MAFKVTVEAVQEWLDDDRAFKRSEQYTTQEVFDLIEDKEGITSDDRLFEALRT